MNGRLAPGVIYSTKFANLLFYLKIMQAIQNEDKKSAGVIQAYSDFVTVRFCDFLLFATVFPFLDAVFNFVTYQILLLFGHCPLLVTK